MHLRCEFFLGLSVPEAIFIQDAPLLRRLLISGGEEHAAERLWLLRLLAGGCGAAEDSENVFRRRFVGELLMSLHDSPLADSALQHTALRTLCRLACTAPAYAADLAQHSGFASWMAALAEESAIRVSTSQVWYPLRC